MATKIKNEYGTITIGNDVIALIAGLAAIDCYGIVGMASKNVKDGLVELLRLENLKRGIKLRLDESGLFVELHIIVEYGTNIPAIADSIVSTVRYKIEQGTGIPVQKVFIFVEDIHIDR